jgi:hypothetical protein
MPNDVLEIKSNNAFAQYRSNVVRSAHAFSLLVQLAPLVLVVHAYRSLIVLTELGKTYPGPTRGVLVAFSSLPDFEEDIRPDSVAAVATPHRHLTPQDRQLGTRPPGFGYRTRPNFDDKRNKPVVMLRG